MWTPPLRWRPLSYLLTLPSGHHLKGSQSGPHLKGGVHLHCSKPIFYPGTVDAAVLFFLLFSALPI